MSNSILSPEDAINAALKQIGFRQRLGTIWDGSEAAKAALDIYGQTRDETLRLADWDFARRDVDLTILKQAPAGGYGPWAPWDPTVNPPPSWLYEYAYPADCIKGRAVQPAPNFVFDFDPQPWVFSVANDNLFTPARRVILSNAPNAVLTYTGQITDFATYQPLFIMALIDALAKKLAPVLGMLTQATAEALKDSTSEAALEIPAAEVSQG